MERIPIESYFEKREISWQNVYYYFQKWSKDGSHTRCQQKEESSGYQARKKTVTTNSFFLCDNIG